MPRTCTDRSLFTKVTAQSRFASKNPAQSTKSNPPINYEAERGRASGPAINYESDGEGETERDGIQRNQRENRWTKVKLRLLQHNELRSRHRQQTLAWSQEPTFELNCQQIYQQIFLINPVSHFLLPSSVLYHHILQISGYPFVITMTCPKSWLSFAVFI